MTWLNLKAQCLKIFCYHGNKSTILLFYSILEQLLKFSVNFTLLKYVKSQRRFGFLITKELIFGCQILDLKDHFSASLIKLYEKVLILEGRDIFCKDFMVSLENQMVRSITSNPKGLKKFNFSLKGTRTVKIKIGGIRIALNVGAILIRQK